MDDNNRTSFRGGFKEHMLSTQNSAGPVGSILWTLVMDLELLSAPKLMMCKKKQGGDEPIASWVY